MASPQTNTTNITNAFSIDVEDYYHVAAFEPYIGRHQWRDQSSRVEANVEQVLALLEQYSVSGTFFTLGWVAERNSRIVRMIAEHGHELASHGYDHTRVTEMTAAQFAEDITKTKKILEDQGGVRIRGYRAPTFSFTKSTTWAYEVLQQAGYSYSSSVYPVRHDLYGIPDAPRQPYKENTVGFTEIPVSTAVIGGRNIPCGGGGFFRLYPYAVTRWALKRLNEIDELAAIFYLHPWEFDPDQPRPTGLGWRARTRHYLNLRRVRRRLHQLFADFSWGRMDEIFGPHWGADS